MATSSPAPPSQLLEKWQRVRERLRGEFGDANYNSWLKPLELADLNEGTVAIRCYAFRGGRAARRAPP